MARLAIMFACLLALPGCSALSALFGESGPLQLQAAVLDATATRCPRPDPTDKNTFKRRVQRPVHWGPEAATAKEMMEHIDRQEIVIELMGAAGDRVVKELERCRARNDEVAAPSS